MTLYCSMRFLMAVYLLSKTDAPMGTATGFSSRLLSERERHSRHIVRCSLHSGFYKARGFLKCVVPAGNPLAHLDSLLYISCVYLMINFGFHFKPQTSRSEFDSPWGPGRPHSELEGFERAGTGALTASEPTALPVTWTRGRVLPETLHGDPAGKTGLCLLPGFVSSHKKLFFRWWSDVE